MANEIKLAFVQNKTVYVIIFSKTGTVYNATTQLFETYVTANLSQYAVSLTQVATSRFYEGNFPTSIPQGVYDLVAFQQLGGSPAESDPPVGSEDGFGWSGTVRLGYADLATSGQLSIVAPVKIFRGEMVQQFPFKMVSSLDHVTPFTSGIVSGQVSRDGAAFGPLQSGQFTEVGLGWYTLLALTSGDLNGGTVALVFTAVGISGGSADQRDFSFILQRGTSGN